MKDAVSTNEQFRMRWDFDASATTHEFCVGLETAEMVEMVEMAEMVASGTAIEALLLRTACEGKGFGHFHAVRCESALSRIGLLAACKLRLGADRKFSQPMNIRTSSRMNMESWSLGNRQA